ncbi:hypothetical protein CPB86DRAFT_803264 [Serendipita vermifera]|nr:hypothetical protein CPB86DRAFT_803264 [Serendipita vermifera]
MDYAVNINYPSVLYKRGRYDDNEALIQPCEADDEGDTIFIIGYLSALCKKPEDNNKWDWTMTTQPESVARMAHASRKYFIPLEKKEGTTFYELEPTEKATHPWFYFLPASGSGVDLASCLVPDKEMSGTDDPNTTKETLNAYNTGSNPREASDLE